MKAIKWRPLAQCSSQSLPLSVRSMLSYKKSMTKHLESVDDCSLTIKVINQGWQQPYQTEAQRLNVDTRQRVYAREIYMLLDNNPYLYARSVLPLTTSKMLIDTFSKLGTKPLGLWLFQQRFLSRSLFEIAQLSQHQQYYDTIRKAIPAIKPHLWARRSVFNLAGNQLLLSEVFLPAMEQSRSR